MKSVIIFHFLTSTYRRCFVFSEGLPQLFFLFSFLILNRALFTTEPENNQGFCAKRLPPFPIFRGLLKSFMVLPYDFSWSSTKSLLNFEKLSQSRIVPWNNLNFNTELVHSGFVFAMSSNSIMLSFFCEMHERSRNPSLPFFCFRNVKQFNVKRAVWFSALLDRCVCQEN
jgi:hypothetical protein